MHSNRANCTIEIQVCVKDYTRVPRVILESGHFGPHRGAVPEGSRCVAAATTGPIDGDPFLRAPRQGCQSLRREFDYQRSGRYSMLSSARNEGAPGESGEIPPNTGNIIRLCANAGARLHLIEPLGFRLSDRDLKRAGLDYHEYTTLEVHASLGTCLDALNAPTLYAFSTRGQTSLEAARFAENDALLFGPESRGLPPSILAGLPQTDVLRIPMTATSRSLNLSNAVAIALYSAWSQLGYAGASK